jgi:transcriptional regulator with XRE-family HTH domain
MTADEVRELLRAKLNGRTHDVLAAELGVTQGYLSKVLASDCNPGEKLLRQIGLRKVVSYEPANVISTNSN